MFDKQSSEMPRWSMGKKKKEKNWPCAVLWESDSAISHFRGCRTLPKAFPGKKSHGEDPIFCMASWILTLLWVFCVVSWCGQLESLNHRVMEYPELEWIHKQHWAQLLAPDRTTQRKPTWKSDITSKLSPSIPSWTTPAVLLFLPALLSPAPRTSMELAGGGLEPWASDRAKLGSGAQEVAPCNRKSE